MHICMQVHFRGQFIFYPTHSKGVWDVPTLKCISNALEDANIEPTSVCTLLEHFLFEV